MSDVVFNLKFTTKKEAKKEKLVFANKIDYIARKEAQKKKDEHFKEDEINEGYIAREGVRERHQEYFTNEKIKDKEDIMYYSSDYGAIKKSDFEKRKLITNEINEIQNKKRSCLYSSAISFTPEFANENIKNKFTEEEFYDNLKPLVNQMLVENNFDKDNTMYFMAIHTNKKNLHVHLEFLEKKPTRRKNALKEETLEKFRGDVNFALNESLKEEYSDKIKELGKTKTEFRNQAKTIEQLENIDYKKAVELYKKNKCRYYGDIKSKKLKKEIDKIAIKILEEEEFKKPLENLDKKLDELDEITNNVYKSKDRSMKENQKQEIELMVKNKIFRNIKIHANENLEEVDKKQIIKNSNKNFISSFQKSIEIALRKAQKKKEYERKKVKNLDYELGIERERDESV